jgi:hypothetical protein
MTTATITDPVIATDKVAVKAAIESLAVTTANLRSYQIGQMIYFYKAV